MSQFQRIFLAVMLMNAATVAFLSSGYAAPVVVKADFGEGADYPLSKSKFSVFNSGFITLDNYQRDIHLYEEVQPTSLRVDLWWGGNRWKPKVVTGTTGSLKYNFNEMDQIAALLNGSGVAPYWAYCYVPEPLQSVPGDHRSTPTSYKAWGRILEDYARHAATGPPSRRIRYHEIYNEPDNQDFFMGGLHSYLELYKHGVRGVRAGDAEAVVGGPAIAFTDAWVAPFLDFVSSNSLPLDFFSFHFYPTVPYKSKNVAGVVADMRRELARRPEFATTEMHLNEYNSYKIDYPVGGRQDRHALAAAMLADFAYFLTQPDLTMVHWAQFQDTGGGNWSGMISRRGHRKASFNALKLYNMMPVDRNPVAVVGPREFGAMASSDENQASVLAWNKANEPTSVTIHFNNLPFEPKVSRVIRIDADHGSWGDNPANENLIAVESAIDSNMTSWTGNLPAGGTLCIELKDGAEHPGQKPRPVAKVVRTLRHFPDRTSKSYSDFDERTWTARLGMARENDAVQRLGVIAEELPAVLDVAVETEGNFQKDPERMLGLRLDYCAGDAYTASVLFRSAEEAGDTLRHPRANEGFPWGTKAAPGKIVAVDDFSRFAIEPVKWAPPDWNGQVIITYIMENTGPGTRAKIKLDRR